jgi:hypothetical protein
MTRAATMLWAAMLALLALACGGDDAENGDTPGAATPGSASTAASASTPGTPLPISGDPAFGDVKLASEIDEVTRAPISEVTSYPTDTKAMHAAIQVRNIRAGSEFRFRWTKGPQEATTVVVTVPEDTAESWVSGSVFPDASVPAGEDWLVAVFYNGVNVGSRQFSIVGP